jgi:hypothetical protein
MARAGNNQSATRDERKHLKEEVCLHSPKEYDACKTIDRSSQGSVSIHFAEMRIFQDVSSVASPIFRTTPMSFARGSVKSCQRFPRSWRCKVEFDTQQPPDAKKAPHLV